nr:glucose-methanol-choline oxidoreductase, FAD/NAD(P)-binding domain protein [Tanacetum cinerariifolium]
GELIDVDDQEELCFHSRRLCIYTKARVNIFEIFKIVFRGKRYWIRAKEVSGWILDLLEELDDEGQSVEDFNGGDTGVNEEGSNGEDSDVEEVPETGFEVVSGQKEKAESFKGGSNQNDHGEESHISPERVSQKKGLAQKAKNDWVRELCISNKVNFLALQGELIDVDDQEELCFHSRRLCIYTKARVNIFEIFKIVFRGKRYWIRAKEVSGWILDLLEELDDEGQSVEDFNGGDTGVNEEGSNGEDSDVEEVPETGFEVVSGQKEKVSEAPLVYICYLIT